MKINPDGWSVAGCNIIYAPRGQAGEYAKLATKATGDVHYAGTVVTDNPASEAALHALIFQKGARAIMSALDQIIQSIAAFNFIHPLKLAREIEKAGLCKPGMPTRLQALVNNSGLTWDQLINDALKSGEGISSQT